MRLFIGVSLTMIAFAANSILNRMALSSGSIDPASFAALRIGSGVIVLILIILLKGKTSELKKLPDFKAVLGLTAYMIGFSFAYLNLGAGLGALILFGGVQITMFVGAIIKGQKPLPLQWLGALIAFCGLVYLLLPGKLTIDIQGAGLMVIAAIGWGLYSLRGQLVIEPLLATTLNFIWSLPFAIIIILVFNQIEISQKGVILALLSGGVTSALGYALWYQILPKLNTATAAVSQLTVPIIAMAGGFLLLSESITMTFIISSILVLGGIGLSVYGARKTPKAE